MRCFGEGLDSMTSAGSFDLGYLPRSDESDRPPFWVNMLWAQGPKARNVREGAYEGQPLGPALQPAFVDP